MYRFFLLFLAIILYSQLSCQPNTSQIIRPWGDQGDGTYKNPVLNGNFPDIDIVKQDDTYYLITSTGIHSPGMTVLKSYDLVNWTYVTNIVDQLWWDSSYSPENMHGTGGLENTHGTMGGVWAGVLAYHHEKWYCYFIDRNFGLIVYTTDNIEEGWTDYKVMKEKTFMSDPAVFFDYEKEKAYLICHYESIRDDEGLTTVNKIFGLSWDGMSLLDSGEFYYSGPMSQAAKVYKNNGYYYIFMSEWVHDPILGRDRKQFALRSEDIYGPYEKKYLLEKRHRDDRSACQGALVQAPDGSWWYMHQMVQDNFSYEGRPQHLIPVSWENDWPVLGVDLNGNGVGNTVEKWDKPIENDAGLYLQTSDHFYGSILGPQWSWSFNPVQEKWSLNENKGNLRLYATVPLEDNDVYKIPNILTQRKLGTNIDTVTVKLHLDGLKNGQYGGLCYKGDRRSSRSGYFYSIGIHMDQHGAVYLHQIIDNQQLHYKEFNEKIIYLRSISDGESVLFYYSKNGITYFPLGDEQIMKGSGHGSARIGVFSYNDTGQGYVDFEWFEYLYH